MKKNKLDIFRRYWSWENFYYNRIKDGTFKNDYSVTINIDHFFIRKKYKKKFDNKIGISRNSKPRSI